MSGSHEMVLVASLRLLSYVGYIPRITPKNTKTKTNRSDTGVVGDQLSVHDHDHDRDNEHEHAHDHGHGHDDHDGAVDAQDNDKGNDDSLVPTPDAAAVVEAPPAARGGAGVGGGHSPAAAALSIVAGVGGGGGGGGSGGGRGRKEVGKVEVGPEVLGRWLDLLSGYGDLVRVPNGSFFHFLLFL